MPHRLFPPPPQYAGLSQDVYAIPSAAIGHTTVALTVAGGQIVHGDE